MVRLLYIYIYIIDLTKKFNSKKQKIITHPNRLKKNSTGIQDSPMATTHESGIISIRYQNLYALRKRKLVQSM